MPTSSHPEERDRRDTSTTNTADRTLTDGPVPNEQAQSPVQEGPSAAPLTPETTIVNRVWLVTVYSFAAAFVLSAIGVLVAPFLGVEGTDNIVKVLMLSGGFLAGILAGRGLATDVISRLLQR